MNPKNDEFPYGTRVQHRTTGIHGTIVGRQDGDVLLMWSCYPVRVWYNEDAFRERLRTGIYTLPKGRQS